MADPTYVERQEGPDGQYCLLLNRVPYDVALAIDMVIDVERSTSRRADAILRNLTWECRVKDYLTGEMTADVGQADPYMVLEWRNRAVELWNEWRKAAKPGPKGSSRTASQTPPSETDSQPVSEIAA